MRLSLIIPCYNEAKNLVLLVPKCAELTRRAGCEVVLVDNGSKDETPSVMRDLLVGVADVRSVRVEVNKGYGFGILSGLRATQGDILGWTHADIQTDPLDAVAGLEFFKTAPDPARLFVKGKRYGRPLADAAFTAGMSVFETVLLGCQLSDINAQPTMFHRSFFETWTDPPHDFSLDLFAFVMARRAKLEVRRFPVRFGERAFGVSHWNVGWRGKQKFIARTLDYSFKLKAALSRTHGVR